MKADFNKTKKKIPSGVKCQRGFTLVEILIGILLIGIVSLLVLIVFFGHFKLFSSQTTIVDVSSQNQIGLTEITNQIREGGSVLAPQGLALDAASSAASSGPTDSLTWQHTISEPNPIHLIIVGVAFEPRPLGLETVSSVKYNNVSLARKGTENNGTNVRVEMWSLLTQDTGTHDITVTLSSQVPKIVGGATSWSGFNYNDPLGTFVSAWDIIGSPHVDLTSSSDEIILDIMGYDSNITATADQGQTERWNQVTTNGGIFPEVRGATSSKPGAANVTMSWTTQPYPIQWVIGAVPIFAAPTPSPSPGSCNGEISTTQVLALQIWPIDTNGNPLDPSIAGYDCIVYTRDSTKNTLTKKTVPSAQSSRPTSEVNIAANVSDLQFTYTPNIATANVVTVTITTLGTADKKNISYTQSAKAVLRNK